MLKQLGLISREKASTTQFAHFDSFLLVKLLVALMGTIVAGLSLVQHQTCQSISAKVQE